MKNKPFIAKIVAISLVALSSASVAAAALAWFTSNKKDTENEHVNGDVGLRGYFYDGDGSSIYPYEIVTPTHFYNLCRLQNLGVFPTKKHFIIGHNNGTPENPNYQCIVGSDGHGEFTWGDYLDMDGAAISPIGNEETPFVGDFNGHGIPIKNLEVRGYPEDVGVFGYVSYEGAITGLVCQDLDIVSLGYSTSTSDQTYELFHPEIDDLFNESAHYFAKDTSLSFYNYNGSSYVGTNLKHENGLSGTAYDEINASSNVVTIEGEPSTIYNGYFLPTYPTVENDPFTYSWRSSSPLVKTIEAIDIDGDGTNDPLIMIDLDPLKESGVDEGKFNYTDANMQIDTRVSLYATVEVDGYIYSRVIQSYTIEFYSNTKDNIGSIEEPYTNQTVYNAGKYSMAMFCDYVANEDASHRVTNYHHGNNIGFLAGHLDGSMTYCYVYRGSFSFNDTGYYPIESESVAGLIGEVGTNVINALDPDSGYGLNGDTGVINFTRVYEGIRGNLTGGSVVKAGYNATHSKNYYSYDSVINDTDAGLFNNYEQYLRYINVAGSKHYVSNVGVGIPNGEVIDPGDSASEWHNYTVTQGTLNNNARFNSVDFLWNKVIGDEEGIDRGLGVFKIATVYDSNASDPDNYNHACSRMGDTAIINGSPKTKVYFSTAEYDHTAHGSNNPDAVWDEDQPMRASSIPSYSDIFSYDYPFSRDYNYCFELDLEDMGKSKGYNYMSNTDSPFLTNYLSSKLIDKKGQSIEPGSQRFGFMFRSSKNETLTSLSSYLPVKKPDNKQRYGDNYYPSNSIVFQIDNENGANVSVVGNGNDITIYSYNPHVPDNDVTRMYTMKSSNYNTDADRDVHRYFTYDVETGATGTHTVNNDNNMKDNNALYAHVFKLPQGHYVLGASGAHSNANANIYFLAVQGQNDADIGGNVTAELGSTLSDVDFLVSEPTKANFPDGLDKAQFNFAADFNSQSGDFIVDTQTVSGNNYLSLEFEDAPVFVTYLSAYSTSNAPRYYIRDEEFTKTFHVYRQH
ncbi:MAG: hypothetical protein J6I84_06050 [Bacilli bacterium]|nr:hypothetical protein [Bacilli bacterium]